MRIIPLFVLLPFLSLKAQSDAKRWHGSFGITEATLKFQQNGGGAFAFPLHYDLLRGHNGSLSLGTNLKLGSEDEYGVSFPAILIVMALVGLAGGDPDLSGLSAPNSSSSSGNGYSVNLFMDFPLMLQYNRGLGTTNRSEHRFGWFVGAGVTYTITGVNLSSSGHGTSENFLGWIGNIGVRFAGNSELGFSTTLPFQNSVGPIRHPLFFALTYAVSIGEH
jgi:hypothetical protein